MLSIFNLGILVELQPHYLLVHFKHANDNDYYWVAVVQVARLRLPWMCVEVSLSKILNPQIAPDEQLAPCT